MAKAEIELLTKQFAADFNDGNLDKVVDTYTDDGQLLAPNVELLKGKEAIKAVLGGMREAGIKNLVLETSEVSDHGEIAYEIGRYNLDAPTPDGQFITDKGKYVVIWKKVGDSFKMAVDTFNSDLPLPG